MQPVSLFIPCIVDQWLPHIGTATAALLRRVGCRPFFRQEQTCCGQVVYNAGRMNAARKMARRFIGIFEHEPAWQQRALDLGSRVFELSEFLVDRMQVTDVGARFAGRAAYHESCSLLYGLGISRQPRRLLEGVEGLELVAMEGAETCCGFGGRFSIEYPEISSAMAGDKAAWFVASGADVLVMCEHGFLLNISGYMSRHHPEKHVVHMAPFLADHLDGVC
jgi:L-lactate dehydrogenase complex protein LldE